MFVLLVFALLAVVGVIIYKFAANVDLEDFGLFIAIVVMIIGLTFSAFGIPLTRCSDYETIASYNVMQRMLIESRVSNSVEVLERAAIMSKVFDINERLEYSQRWNNSQWDWWHPDEIMKLEPLK